MFKYLLVLTALCGPNARAATPTQIMSRIQGKEISDLIAGHHYAIAKQGVVVKVSPVQGDAIKRHFEVTKYTARDGLAFVTFATFKDEEDGGNSLGWVESVGGKIVARISDSFFEAVAAANGDDPLDSSLSNTPRAIAPALNLDNEAARNTFLSKLVEEFEERKVGDELSIDIAAGEKLCTVARDRKTATCALDYLQDRFNGTLKAVIQLDALGRGVVLREAHFGGNF